MCIVVDDVHICRSGEKRSKRNEMKGKRVSCFCPDTCMKVYASFLTVVYLPGNAKVMRCE